MYSDITGIILSGGKSSRMGGNKSLLKLGNQTIIERIVELMKSIFDDIMIITNTLMIDVPWCSCVRRYLQMERSIGGNSFGLTYSKTEKNFIISCDTPLMTKEMIEYIINFKTQKPITFCEAAGYHQPLVGVYKKEVVAEIEKLLNTNSEIKDRSLHHFLKEWKQKLFIQKI